MADRGVYRAIKVVLLDGPDFQKLPERARWVFLALKMSMGPAGIEVHYPEALAYQLAERTGAPVFAVKEALDVLEGHGWILRQGNIVWIVGQLRHDPHMDWSDNKHRKSIWGHLLGLPRLEIVGSFVRAYPGWFEAATVTTPKGDVKEIFAAPAELLHPLHEMPGNVDNSDDLPLRRAIEGPSKGLARAIEAPITEDRRPKTEDREQTSPKPPSNSGDVEKRLRNAIKTHLYLGRDPVVIRGTEYRIPYSVKIAKELVTPIRPLDEIIMGIEHVRYVGDIPADEPLTMAYLKSQPAMLTQAISEGHKRSEVPDLGVLP